MRSSTWQALLNIWCFGGTNNWPLTFARQNIPKMMGKWIHLCGMPLNITMLELTKFLEQRTSDISKTMMIHSSRGRFKGYALIKYETPDQAQSAAEVLTFVILKGRHLHAVQCRDRHETQIAELDINDQQDRPWRLDHIDRHEHRNRHEDREDRRRLSPIRPARKTRYGKCNKRKELEEVLNDLRNPDRLENGSMASLSDRTGIPKSTLKTWRKRIKLEPNWTISRFRSDKGQSRVLTEETEEEIHKRLTKYIDNGLYCPRKVLEATAMSVASENGVANFRASRAWQTGFMSRFALSFRTPHMKRRQDPNDEIIGQYCQDFDAALVQYPRNLIFNMDETCWRIINGTLKTLQRKGTDNVIINLECDPKLSVSVITTISASGEKFPLWVIATGKSGAERKFRDNLRAAASDRRLPLIFCHTDNGWATTELMKEYLKWLSERVNGRKCHLIWDLHSSHRNEEVKAQAKELEINLQYVPAGQTGFWQPLDAGIFGSVKSKAKTKFDEKVMEAGPGGETRIGIFQALEILYEIWKDLDPSTVISAWSMLIDT